MHGCPHYGVAIYDAEGYNQDGFHHETGLNREGLTRRQDITWRRGEDPEAEDEEDEEEEEDPHWQVLQHLAPEQRIALHILEGEAREGALARLQVQLFEEQGITFSQEPVFGQHHAPAPVPGQPQPQQGEDDGGEGEGEDGEEGEEGEDSEVGEDDEAAEDMPVLEPLPNNHLPGAGPNLAQAEHGGHAPYPVANPRVDPNPYFRPDLWEMDALNERDRNEARRLANRNPVAVPNAPADTNLEAASLDSNASYVGSDVHERLAHDFPSPFVNDRDGEVTPATPSEHGDPATSTDQEHRDRDEPLMGIQEHKRTPYGGVPGAFPLDG